MRWGNPPRLSKKKVGIVAQAILARTLHHILTPRTTARRSEDTLTDDRISRKPATFWFLEADDFERILRNLDLATEGG